MAAVACLAVPTVALSTTSGAVEAVPPIGATCQSADFWREIPVVNRAKPGDPRPSLTPTKAGARIDTVVCVPMAWTPESDSRDFIPGAQPWQRGSWQYIPYPKRLGYDSAKRQQAFAPSASQNPCRLDQMQSRSADSPDVIVATPAADRWGLSSFDRTARGFIPSTGTVRGLMVTVAPEVSQRAFSRGSMTSAWNDSSRELGAFASDYYWNQSMGRMDLRLTVDEQVHFIPNPDPTSDGSQPPNPVDSGSAGELLTAIDGEVDFAGYDFVVLQRYAGGRSNAEAGRPAIVLDGNPIRNVYNHYRQRAVAGSEDEGTIVHELGHLLGLPDLYAEGQWDNYRVYRFAADMSLMEASQSRGLTGYERWILGWVPTKGVYCVAPEPVGPVNLSMKSLDGNDLSSVKLVVVKGTRHSDEALVFELRSNEYGRYRGFADPGLLVYRVFASGLSARPVGTDRPQALVYQGSHAPLVTYRRDASTLSRIDGPPLEPYDARMAWLDADDALLPQLQSESVLTNGEHLDWWNNMRIDNLRVRTDASGRSTASLTFQYTGAFL